MSFRVIRTDVLRAPDQTAVLPIEYVSDPISESKSVNYDADDSVSQGRKDNASVHTPASLQLSTLEAAPTTMRGGGVPRVIAPTPIVFDSATHFGVFLAHGIFADHWHIDTSAPGLVELVQSVTAKATALLHLGGRCRNPSGVAIAQLCQEFARCDGAILMRHGAQVTSKIFADETPAACKVRQMQHSDNRSNHASPVSWAEAAGMGALLVAILSIESGTEIRIRTSENQRARDVAEILAAFLGTSATIDSRLTCVDYADTVQLPRYDDPSIPSPLNADGTVPWDRARIDAACGDGTYERVHAQTTAIMADITHPVPNLPAGPRIITLCLTHTQQLNVVGVQARISELGMCIQTPSGSVLLPNGIYG